MPATLYNVYITGTPTNSKSFTLQLSAEDLSTLRRVVDDSLNVTQARTALKAEGRKEALQQLKGEVVMRDKLAPSDIVKRMNIGNKKKRTRPCQWPSRPEDRARVNNRTKERRAQNLPSPFASGRISNDGDVYFPSFKEQKLLNTLRTNISEALALDPAALSVPKAVVSVVGTNMPRSLHRQTGMCIQLSINQCDKVDVSGETPASNMPSGEAFAFDTSVGYRMPAGGELKGKLFFTAHGDPL